MAGKGLTPEQKRTALQILAAGRKAGLSSPMTDKAAIETAIVEAGLTNPDGGHGDSGGWRQARRSIYPDVTNVQKTATDFYTEAAAVKGKYGTAGDLAAAVQRPRSDLRGKYGAVGAQADQILAELAGKRQTSAGQAQAGTVGGTPAGFDQGAYEDAQRKQTLATYLTRRGKNYGGLSALFSSGTLSTAPVDRAQFETAATPGTKVTTSSKSARGGAAGRPTGKVTVAASANRAGVKMQQPILDFLKELAGASGRAVSVGTGTNHNRMTLSGNVSDHWAGNAADLPMPVDSRAGDLAAAHAIAEASGMKFDKALAMARKGGVWDFDTPKGHVQILWKTNVGGNHHDHVHVGLNPNR